MKGIFLAQTALVVATHADYLAGNFPVFGGYNFTAGADSIPMPTTIKPAPAESTTDFSVRFTAWLQSFLDSVYGTGNVTNLLVTFTDDGANVSMLATGQLKITANDPVYLPMFNPTPNGALGLKGDKDGATTVTYTWSLASIQDGVPAPNYNSQVNNYPGSGYTARV